MDELILVRPGAEHAEQVMAYKEEMAKNGDSFDGCAGLEETETYEEWLDFVSECRAGRIQGNWDIIRGGIANDKVFRTLDLYFSGDIGKEDALRRLVYERPNYQICFRTQLAIDKCLTYIDYNRL